MIDFYLISVLVFFAFLAIIIYRDRKKIQVTSYIVFMRRTKKFRSFIDRTAKKSPRVWKLFGTTAVIASFVLMGIGTFLLVLGTTSILSKQITEPAASFVLPTVTSQTVSAPGVIGIPFWFWIIAVAIVIMPHEFMHGVLARAENIRLKSVGLLLFLVIPGAFVEPDEKQLKRKKLMPKLRVFAVGSFINVLIGIALLLLMNQAWASNVQPGLLITSVNQTSPAYESGLRPGMIIQSIENSKMHMNFWDYSFLVLKVPGAISEKMPEYAGHIMIFSSLAKFKPNETVTMKIDGIERNFTFGESPFIEGFPYMGINTSIAAKDTTVFSFIYPLFAFVWILSFFVGIFNMMPIYPLDGGLIIESVSEKFSRKHGKKISRIITYVLLFVLIFNFIGPYII